MLYVLNKAQEKSLQKQYDEAQGQLKDIVSHLSYARMRAVLSLLCSSKARRELDYISV